MRSKLVFLGMAIAVSGCASAGGRSDLPPVRVYTEEEAPCEYEVMRRVRAQTASTITSSQAYERARDRALGQEGAKVGADAVIVPSIGEGTAGRAVRREVGRRIVPPPMTTFRGEAVRFIPGTCGLVL